MHVGELQAPLLALTKAGPNREERDSVARSASLPGEMSALFLTAFTHESAIG